MHVFARLIGIAALVLLGIGAVNVVAHPPALPQPTLDFLQRDERPTLTINPGDRMTFDHPMTWNIDGSTIAEVWSCDGHYQVVVGPATVDNVCILALQNK